MLRSCITLRVRGEDARNRPSLHPTHPRYGLEQRGKGSALLLQGTVDFSPG